LQQIKFHLQKKHQKQKKQKNQQQIIPPHLLNYLRLLLLLLLQHLLHPPLLHMMPKNKKKKSKKYTSVQDYGVCFDQNWKHRRRMEDAHVIIDGFNDDPRSGFFAVYDGHGGKEAANYAAENLHKVLIEELIKHPENICDDEAKMKEILTTVYSNTDEALKEKVPSHHGCTAITVYLTGKEDSRSMHVANAGDARAILCRNGKAIRMSYEHKAADEEEAKRIADTGGFIINGRVNGQIMITRSLGDHLMKEFIISTPFTYHTKLTKEDTWLIVACDGLWDVCEDQQAVDFVLEWAGKGSGATELSKRLLIKALQDGSTDNLSIIVVKL